MKNQEPKSKCCNAPTKTVCDEDFGRIGTCHWECLKCGKACDVDLGQEPKENWEETLKNYCHLRGFERLDADVVVNLSYLIRVVIQKKREELIEEIEKMKPKSVYTDIESHYTYNDGKRDLIDDILEILKK